MSVSVDEHVTNTELEERDGTRYKQRREGLDSFWSAGKRVWRLVGYTHVHIDIYILLCFVLLDNIAYTARG